MSTPLMEMTKLKDWAQERLRGGEEPPWSDYCMMQLIEAEDVLSSGAEAGFFDVSNGIEEVSEGGCDQVDHGDEGGGVSVSASPCPGGLEEAVQALHAGVVMVDVQR